MEKGDRFGARDGPNRKNRVLKPYLKNIAVKIKVCKAEVWSDDFMLH